jgi:hypothetical protein
VGEILAISISPYGDHRLLIKAKNILRYHSWLEAARKAAK